MDNNLMACFTNPVMCKLYLEIHARGEVTAKQLAETYREIPQTTLYRYLKRMTDAKVLRVTQETPVRGTVEKTYALRKDLSGDIERIIANNEGDAYLMLFMQYISGFIQAFQTYIQQKDINIKDDYITFSTAPIYATNRELESAMEKIGKVVEGLLANGPSPQRKLRNLGLIITPPQEIKD